MQGQYLKLELCPTPSMVKQSVRPAWNTELIPSRVGIVWVLACFLLSMREGWRSHQKPNMVDRNNFTYKTGN